MTHATRFVAVAVLVALAVGAPVQAQTPEIDALRVRAEAGDPNSQNDLGVRYANGRGVPQDYVQADMWFNLAASRMTGEDRESAVLARDRARASLNHARQWQEQSAASAQSVARRCRRATSSVGSAGRYKRLCPGVFRPRSSSSS